MKKTLAIGLLVMVILLTVTGCEAGSQVSQSGAAQAIITFKVPLNSQGHTVEQQQVWDRIKVTTDPTKVLWIHLITLDGKIIRRMPVTSKVTSSNKRLEPVEAAPCCNGYPGTANDFNTTELIQPDGTFGPSDAYIFWFDPQGRYHQWGTAGGLGYLLTDYPIDLTNPADEITGMFNADKAAYEWQKLQEEQLKIKEGK